MEREDPANKLLTAAEIRARLKISKNTLVRWIKAGEFPQPSYRLNNDRRNRWSGSQLDAYLSARMKPGMSACVSDGMKPHYAVPAPRAIERKNARAQPCSHRGTGLGKTT
jgi:predicted DNA-binding transcriptional regulator AlpA